MFPIKAMKYFTVNRDFLPVLFFTLEKESFTRARFEGFTIFLLSVFNLVPRSPAAKEKGGSHFSSVQQSEIWVRDYCTLFLQNIIFIFKQGLAHDKVKEMRELILERYDKNFDGRLEIDEVC